LILFLIKIKEEFEMRSPKIVKEYLALDYEDKVNLSKCFRGEPFELLSYEAGLWISELKSQGKFDELKKYVG
jgi:hypothetical protein